MGKARTASRRRTNSPPFFLWLGLITGMALILLSVLLFTKQTSGVDKNAAALDVSLENLNGGTPVRLSDYRGKYVLVNLWASWCPPCRAELPDIIAFAEKHKADGLEFAAINTQDERNAASKYVRDHQMNFTVPFDPEGQVLYSWTDGALPDTILLDPEGRVAFKWTGQISPEILEQRVAPLLKQ